MEKDWIFSVDNNVCDVRTVGVLVKDGKILVQRDRDGREFALPGGHLKIGETLEAGLIREYKEETGADIRCTKMLWSEECFWEWKGKKAHNLSFYYLIELVNGCDIPDTGEFVSQKDNYNVVIGWMPIEEIKNVIIYPEFIQQEIYCLDEQEIYCLDGPMKHFVQKDKRGENIMKTIITIQHTQSIHHTNGMVGSWTDWALSDLGVAQAKNIGEKLKEELANKNFVMYSSDLLRAKQTAENVGNHLHIQPILRTELRERNLGKCCGKSVQWLRENLEMQEKTIDDRLFSDAESRRDEWNRLKPFFDEIMSNDEENIIIVSHGDLLSVFNAMFLGLDVEVLNSFDMFGVAGGVSFMFENNEGKRIIKKLSDTHYMR